MRAMGLAGAVRGKPLRTTISDKAVPCPLDRVNRQFQAPRPNALWVSDFTSVDLVGLGLRRLRDRRLCPPHRRLAVSRRPTRLRARCPEQALHDRQPIRQASLIHHSDKGVQYVSLRYTQRLAEAGIEPRRRCRQSVRQCSRQTINGLFKAEVIHRCGPWRSFEAVSSPLSNGWTRSTTGACSSRSETSHRPKQKPVLEQGNLYIWPHDQANPPPTNPARFRLSSRPALGARETSAPRRLTSSLVWAGPRSGMSGSISR